MEALTESPPAKPRAAEGRVDVLHVTQAVKAGLRRHVVDLLLGLDDLGVAQALAYSPIVTDPATEGALATLARRGIRLIELPMVREISPAHDARTAARLCQLLRRLRPRVLHLHSSKAGGVGRLAAAAAAITGAWTTVVYTPHGSAANFSPRYGVLERVLGRLRTDRLVAVSSSEYDELRRRRYVQPEKLVRVDSGLPIDEIESLAAAGGVPRPQGRLVVAAARLSPPKDPRFLVRVSQRLALSHPELHFVWAGDGELRDAVERDIAHAGLGDRWTLTGWLANPYPLLAAADVVVLPSDFECFGYATLEAMILRRPVVATDVTGSRDLVIPGTTGELVPVGDEAAFAAAIARIVSSPELARRYGIEGRRQAARHFTRERMAAEMLTVYDDASARRSS